MAALNRGGLRLDGGVVEESDMGRHQRVVEDSTESHTYMAA